MKKIPFILLAVLLALSSCRPKGVLSNKEMEDVLVDLHAAEGVLQVAGYNYGHESDCNLYYAVVLKKHGITQAEFDSSLMWYTAHPAYFRSVYPKVLARLQKRADEENVRLKAQADKLQQQYEDSIANARFRQQLNSCSPQVRDMLILPDVSNYVLLRFDSVQPFTDRLYERQKHVADSLRHANDSILRAEVLRK